MKIDGTLHLALASDDGMISVGSYKNTIVNSGIEALVSALSGSVNFDDVITGVTVGSYSSPPQTQKTDTNLGTGGRYATGSPVPNISKTSASTVSYATRILAPALNSGQSRSSFSYNVVGFWSGSGSARRLFSRIVLGTPLTRTRSQDIVIRYDLTFS